MKTPEDKKAPQAKLGHYRFDRGLDIFIELLVFIQHAHVLIAFPPTIDQISQSLERIEEAVAAVGLQCLVDLFPEPLYNLAGWKDHLAFETNA